MRKMTIYGALLPTVAAVLVACGGGGGGSTSSLPAGGGNASMPILSGTAAYGAPVEGATITVYDATGTVVGTGVTGTLGSFNIQLTTQGVAPYTLKLSKDEILLHAIHTDATSGIVNITPLSDAVAAMVSPTGTADGLVASLQNSAAAPTKASVEAKQQIISTALSPVVTATGASGNLFNSSFSANGQGQDKLLDSVSVVSTADGVAKTANVQLIVKVATDPENPAAQLPVININSASTVADANAEKAKLGAVTAADLPTDNAAALYAGLIDNLNRCYKDAPTVRTNGSNTVLSAACKKVFLDNDPAQYLNYGERLGSNAQFAGMFTYTGAVDFKPVSKSYLAQDLAGTKSSDGKGRAIVAMSWVNEHGNRENIMLYVTKYTLDGEVLLGLSGDRNTYGWGVVSHNQKREFPLRSDRQLDYVQSQYLISVRDVVRSGKSVVNYAKVTSPTGKKILLASAPGGASRDLAICRSTEINMAGNVPTTPKNTESTTYGSGNPKYYCTGTSKSLTMAQSFVDPSQRNRLPSDIKDVGILRPLNDSGQPYTPDSATLASYPSISMWEIEYNFMDGSKKTQKTWSVARPMTVEELLGPNGPDAVMPRYTADTMSAIKSLKTQQGNALTACNSGDASCDAAQSPVPAPASGGYRFAWTESAVPMTSLWISGALNDVTRSWISSGGNATRWDDQLGVRSTLRQAEVKCSRQSSLDAHCQSGVAVGTLGGFNALSWMTYSELWGKDAEQRNMMRSYNWYQPRKQDGTPF